MFSPYPKTLQVFGAQSRGGASDARFIKEYCPVAEFGLVGQTMHQINECAAVEDLEKLTEIYCRFIQGFFAA